MMIRALLLLLVLPAAAQALESRPYAGAHDTATLVSEVDDAAPGRAFRIGLRLRMQPGWHTYWSNPGDAGAPPTLEAAGVGLGPIQYPMPERLTDGPFTSYAYTGEVLLPAQVSRAGAGGLDVHATWLVCATVCIPEDAHLHLDIPAGAGSPGADAPSFQAADLRMPRPSPFAASIGPDGTLRLEGSGLAARSATFFPAEPGVIDQGAPQALSVDAHGLSLRLKRLPAAGHTALAGVLTLTDRTGQTTALQIAAVPGPAAPEAATGLLQAVLLALAGGLILNLMPCVLPVLAIKALALARLSGAARGRIRREAGLYTAGVLVAFTGLGAATLAAGAASGWGGQFHSVVFTTAIAWLMLAIGLNLSGLFEVGASGVGVGQSLAARSSFFTGLLAVVVATPCTAPFMAAALAAAATLPPAEGMAIFVALGLGLAAPYALLAVIPAAARLLPRPGRWMETLKRVLALPMYATAAFFAWVVSRQAGALGLVAVLAGAGLLALTALRLGREQRAGTPGAWRHAARAAIACLVLLLGVSTWAPSQAGALPMGDGAEPYSAARLAALRAAHRPVLVDMSAAWCVTCLVNERLALAPRAVQDAFARHKVGYLKGDWTGQDPAITAFLQQYGRTGVPLYVFYPVDGAPVVLPQILTEAAILGQLGV